MSRIGKIARLPHYLRSQLNERIEDGEPGRPLLEWLNALPAVRDTLAEHFGGRPISEQNLSEWKQGGFKDWQRHQETRALARGFLAEAEELEEEVGATPLPDRLSETVALALARLLREAMEGEPGPEQRSAILEIVRELGRWRQGDRQMEERRREEEVWEAELEAKVREEEAGKKAELQAMQDGIEFAKTKTRVYGNIMRQEYCDGIKAGTLDPERAADLRNHFATHAEWLRECGVKGLPASNSAPPAAQAESR